MYFFELAKCLLNNFLNKTRYLSGILGNTDLVMITDNIEAHFTTTLAEKIFGMSFFETLSFFAGRIWLVNGHQSYFFRAGFFNRGRPDGRRGQPPHRLARLGQWHRWGGPPVRGRVRQRQLVQGELLGWRLVGQIGLGQNRISRTFWVKFVG